MENNGGAMATLSKFPCFNVVHLAVKNSGPEEVEADAFLISNRELHDLINMSFNKTFLTQFGEFYHKNYRNKFIGAYIMFKTNQE